MMEALSCWERGCHCYCALVVLVVPWLVSRWKVVAVAPDPGRDFPLRVGDILRLYMGAGWGWLTSALGLYTSESFPQVLAYTAQGPAPYGE